MRKNPGNRVRGTGFDVPGDREKRLETRKMKVRKQQVGVIDSTAILASFPQLAVVVSIPQDALSCVWYIRRRKSCQDAIQRANCASL